MTKREMSRERARYTMIYLAEPDKVERYGSIVHILPAIVEEKYILPICAEMAYIETHGCVPPWGLYVDGRKYSNRRGHPTATFVLDKHLVLGVLL